MDMAAAIALGVIGLLAVFQVALACGAPLGHFAWGGKSRVLPAKLRIGSIAAIATYGIFAVFVLSKTGWAVVIENQLVLQIGLWAITAYLALMIVANAASRSKYERYTMTPIAAVLAICFLVVAIG